MWGKRAWYQNPGRYLIIKRLIMKNLESLGRILSKDEQKRIMGGDEEVQVPDGGCGRCTRSIGNTTYIYSCNSGSFVLNGTTYPVCLCSNSNGGQCH